MIKSGFHTTSSVVMLFAVPVFLNWWLAIHALAMQPIATILVPSIILMFSSDEFLKADSYWPLAKWLGICLVGIFCMNFFFNVTSMLTAAILLRPGITILVYLHSNLSFILGVGIYVMCHLWKKGSYKNLFAIGQGTRWKDFFIGVACCSLLFFMLNIQILTSVPLLVMCLALCAGLVVTGMQSLFEELTVRMMPLSFFKTAQKQGLSERMAYWSYLFISTVVFGMNHLSLVIQGGIFGPLVQYSMGIVWGVLAWEANGVEYTTGLHTANNVMCFVFISAEILNAVVAQSGGSLRAVRIITGAFLVVKYIASIERSSLLDISPEKPPTVTAGNLKKENQSLTPGESLSRPNTTPKGQQNETTSKHKIQI